MPAHGLPAAAYAPLVDVDPPLAEHVLEILATANLLAYAEPLVGDTGPYRDVRAPDRPTTRVFVERSSLATARHVVEQQLPALRADFHAAAAAVTDAEDMSRASAEQVDRAWQEIISGFHTDASPDRPEQAEPPGSGLSQRLVREHTAPDSPPTGPRDYTVYEDPDDDRFVPEPPPPLPRPRDRFDVAAWAGIIGGPLAMVAAFVLGWGSWLAAVGFIGFTAGFIALVARSGSARDDGDDGAVV